MAIVATAPSGVRCVAVDWSGRVTGAKRFIWIAEAVDGRLTVLEDGRDRDETIDWVTARAAADPQVDRGLRATDRIGIRGAKSVFQIVWSSGSPTSPRSWWRGRRHPRTPSTPRSQRSSCRAASRRCAR
jgi:hypothetical protein